MQIRRLPRDPGPAGWNAILPPEDPRPALRGAKMADWLVIGAGFAGLAAARRLTQLCPGKRIVVLEATRIAHGPAGRNSGFMIDLPHDLTSSNYGGNMDADRYRIEMARAGIDFAAEAAQEYGLGLEAFARTGKINAAATERGHQHNLSYAKHLAAMGETNEMVDAAGMRALTGSDYYLGGLFTPGTAMIQPALFVRGVARGLKGAGVDILEMSPVIGLERCDGAWTATTPEGSVRAPKAVLAVNGHAESFGFFRSRLLHVFTYASMTRALTPEEAAALGGAPNWACTPADPMGTTVRRVSGTGGNRIVVRNRFTCDPSMEVPDGRIAAIARAHDQAFQARFPMIGGVEMEYRWGGRLCLSWNDVPAFGEVSEDLYAACCQNGLGVVRGTVAGMLAAELATGHQSALLDQFLSNALPARLPPEPIARIGATLTIRWREFCAGREV